MTSIHSVGTNDTRVLAIIGQGYVGLPLAMAAVDSGWKVIGVDSFHSKVSQINSGSSPVEDISDDRLILAIKKGLYKATSDYSEIRSASVVTICVPTPLDNAREPDLQLLRSAAASIAPHLSTETLVVSESTSYPGTLRDVIIPIVEELKNTGATKLFYASAPERVNPGDEIWTQKNTPRLVGAIDQDSIRRALDFYGSICEKVQLVATPEIAESAKLLENTFRLVNIALINEFAQLCAASGINVNEVIDAASSKPYGFMPFRPGVGVGGHCIPVDPLYLTWWARRNGKKARVVELCDEINHEMPEYIALRTLHLVKEKSNPRVLIIGVAYKSGISDVRETPATELIQNLRNRGAIVSWHDPLVVKFDKSEAVSIEWDCDVAVLVTKQPGVDLSSVLEKGVPILDCTNQYSNIEGILPL